MPNIHSHDSDWLNRRLHGLPSLHKSAIMHQYHKKPTRREANLHVLHTTKAIAAVLGKVSQFYSVNVEDRDHKAKAKHHARQCVKIAARETNEGLYKTYRAINRYIKSHHLVPHKISTRVIGNLKANCLTDTELAQVRGVLKRANDEAWWKPKLRKLHNRQIETISRLLNQANKHKGIYASHVTVDNYKRQWQDNQQLLEQTIATNEDGFSMSLAELSKLNVSNPAIRKAELMVRIRGFEDYAKEMGYSALFFTMTTPSKYHRSYSKSGDENPNWNGAPPLDGQDYLNRTFQRIRASLKRDNINPFGFRVAEPHHDGTPHWHLLFFIPTEQQQALADTFEQYCLEEDGEEHGAKERRFKIEYIGPDKGSATAYVFKYINKNIDGQGMEYDSYGKDAVDSAVRVKVWASCWGIRQFQQIGGVGVTQWRELRRLNAIKDKNLDWVEEIRKAADESNWSRYTELMGGVFCKREDQLIRPLYANKLSKAIPTTEDLTEQAPNLTELATELAPEMTELVTERVPELTETSHQKTNSQTGKNLSKIVSTEQTPNQATELTERHNQTRVRHSVSYTETTTEFPIYKSNRYGDELITQLKGIVCLGVEIITRVHEWTLSQSPAPKAFA